MTEIVVRHPTRGRLYVRQFDHDDAVRRIAAGETAVALAREYGVTPEAVRQAVRRATGGREASNAAHRAWRTTTCEMCGGPAMKLVGGKRRQNGDGRILCTNCRNKERRQNIRVTPTGAVSSVRCQGCREWKLPADFPRGQRFRDLREGGFHSHCRACGSAARREYRDRTRVPCEAGCGRTVEGKGRANTAAGKNGERVLRDPGRPYLCHACATTKRAAA